MKHTTYNLLMLMLYILVGAVLSGSVLWMMGGIINGN